MVTRDVKREEDGKDGDEEGICFVGYSRKLSTFNYSSGGPGQRDWM